MQRVQALAEGLALRRAVERDVERPPRDPQPAHAMRQPGWRQAYLRVVEPAVHLAQDRFIGHETILEQHFRVAGGKGAVHRVDGAHDCEPGIPGIDQEHCGALLPRPLPWRRGGRARHADGERRAGRPADEPLVSVDHPATVHPDRRCLEHRRVRAGAGRRFGHGEARPDLSSRERRQVPRLLLRVGDGGEQVHVALVGRGAVEGLRAQQAVAGLLEHDTATAHVEPQPTEIARDLRSEEAGLLCEPLQVLAQVRIDAVYAVVPRFQGNDGIPDEVPGPSLQGGQIVRQGKVDAHGHSFR